MDELIWYTQYTYIPPPSRIEINSAPVLSSPAIMYLCLNEINSRTLEFFDAENDSLSVELYHLNRVLEGVAPPYPISNSVLVTYADGYDYQNPILGSPGFNIDPSTFEITSLPSEEGTYLVGLKVNEWRNGELINFIMYNMTVFVRSCGNIEANFSVPECSGLELEIENLSLYSTDFMWDFGIPNSPADTSSQQIPIASFPEAGEYEVTLIAQPGSCADTLIQPVVVSPPIDVSFSLDDPECANGQWLVEFVPDGIIAENTEISWSFANGTPENSQAFEPISVLFDPNQTVISSISADNGYCNSIYEFEFVLPNYPSVEIIDLIDPCPGYEISFDALTSGADSFHWDFGDLTSSLDFSFLNNPVYDYSQEGDYLVQLTINEGSSCEMTDTSLFSILANQDIELIYDVHVPELCDQPYAVNVHWLGQNDLSLQWDMGDGSILQESSFAYTYGGPGEHTISLTATNEPCPGFSAEQITIQLTEIGLDPNAPMIYPNVFTPGIDSLNKYFRPVHPQEVTSTPLDQNTDVYNLFDLQIFNRYGQQVFKSDEQIRGWDGKINGEFAPEGTYYYTFNYRLPCMDSPKSYSNQLTLIRD
jgi:gliding motility-associated-like protein